MNVDTNAQVISIITDTQGNIISNNFNYVPLLKLALSNLNIIPNQKFLLANILEKNYIICKLPLTIGNDVFIHYIFEEWKIDNNIPIVLSKNIFINQSLKDIRNFSDFEQEIIYCLLSSYTVDKEIYQFLTNITQKKIKGNVRYMISALYEKFSCDNRADLISLLRAHELNACLPKTIFPPGTYPIKKIQQLVSKVVVF